MPLIPPDVTVAKAEGVRIEHTVAGFKVLDRDDNELCVINESAAIILELCAHGRSARDIIDQLGELYPDARPYQVHETVPEVLDRLLACGAVSACARAVRPGHQGARPADDWIEAEARYRLGGFYGAPSGALRRTGEEAAIVHPPANQPRGASGVEPYDPAADPPWRLKKSSAAWRGPGLGDFDSISLEAFVERLDRLADPGAGVQVSLPGVWRLVCRYRHHGDIDAGFTVFPDLPERLANIAVHSELHKPSLPLHALLQNRFLIVVEDDHVVEALRLALRSNSVAVMPPPRCGNALTRNLRAWEHFVPVDEDFSNLEDTLQWCRHHDEDCRDLSIRASRLIEPFLDADNERAVRRRVLELAGTAARS